MNVKCAKCFKFVVYAGRICQYKCLGLGGLAGISSDKVKNKKFR
jgi:hypothetical protein